MGEMSHLTLSEDKKSTEHIDSHVSETLPASQRANPEDSPYHKVTITAGVK